MGVKGLERNNGNIKIEEIDKDKEIKKQIKIEEGGEENAKSFTTKIKDFI